MRIALYQPDIPQNTGTILRLSACMEITVDIIGPTGFDMTSKSLRRSGLDYLDYVKIQRHISFETFFNEFKKSDSGRLVLLTTHGKKSHLEFSFKHNDTLLLGRESSGVPEKIHNDCDHQIRIPMKKNLRSLNIAVTASIVLGEALRQTNMFPK